jgi:hypothetical protein
VLHGCGRSSRPVRPVQWRCEARRKTGSADGPKTSARTGPGIGRHPWPSGDPPNASDPPIESRGRETGYGRKPSSVPLGRVWRPREVVICLGWPSPATSSSLPAAVSLPPLALGPGWAVWVAPRRLFGLAPTGGCRAAAVAIGAVGSYPTVSPLPPLVEWRSVFCGPIRRLSAPRRYLAVYPLELGLSSEAPARRHPATTAPSPVRASNLPRPDLGRHLTFW